MAELTWKGDVASEMKMRDHIVTTDSNSDEGRNLGPHQLNSSWPLWEAG